MSLEERVAALEKGFIAMQHDFLLHRADTTSSSTLSILNKVIATQELNYREISENETMLVGMFGSMQKDVRTLQEDVSTLKEDVGVLQGDVSILKEDVGVLRGDVSSLKESVASIDGKLERVLRLLTNLS